METFEEVECCVWKDGCETEDNNYYIFTLDELFCHRRRVDIQSDV